VQGRACWAKKKRRGFGYACASWRSVVELDGGEAQESAGRWLDVLAAALRRGGSWRLDGLHGLLRASGG
jgi:hypothetical protein